MLRFKNVSNLPCMKGASITGIEEKVPTLREGFYWAAVGFEILRLAFERPSRNHS